MRHPITLPPNNLLEDERIYIREVQEHLRYLGFFDPILPEVGIDGIFGESTAEAVRQFQRWFDIEQTGVVDRATWELLYARYLAALAGILLPPPPEPRITTRLAADRVG